IGVKIGSILILSVQFYKMRAASFMPYMIEPYVSHYCEEPTLQIAVGYQPTESVRRTKVGLLNQIFGFGPIVRQSHTEPVKRVEVFKRRSAEIRFNIPIIIHMLIRITRAGRKYSGRSWNFSPVIRNKKGRLVVILNDSGNNRQS